jgi:hypothetical protein
LLTAGLEEDKSGQKPLDVQGILEFSQRAHYLYVTHNPAEKAELLKKYF